MPNIVNEIQTMLPNVHYDYHIWHLIQTFELIAFSSVFICILDLYEVRFNKENHFRFRWNVFAFYLFNWHIKLKVDSKCHFSLKVWTKWNLMVSHLHQTTGYLRGVKVERRERKINTEQSWIRNPYACEICMMSTRCQSAQNNRLCWCSTASIYHSVGSALFLLEYLKFK